MNRGKIFLILFLLFCGLGSIHALSEIPSEPADFSPIAAYAQGVETDFVEVPRSIRNNRYFLESVRLTGLAQESYEEGDYDASSDYATEALRYALLSDEYVAQQLKMREANMAVAAARSRLNWAVSVDAPKRYPDEYGHASAEYDNARAALGKEQWDEAVAAANRVLIALAELEALPDGRILPAQYTVRPWNTSKDCLWNIAGRSWAYGDPEKWRLIYNANRAKLPDPNNPDIIEPGMVLDIPRNKDEVRQGMWDPNRTYTPQR